jgi:Kef-type K+ transport system membrane component KefB
LARIINLALTLALLFGVAHLSLSLLGSDTGAGQLTLLMGFVLLVASVAGALAARIGLPKITGFLVVGILAGPSMLAVVPAQALAQLRLIDEFALALIAMMAGGELKIDQLRPTARSIAFTTLTVVGVVWLGVALVFLPVAFLLPFLQGVGFWGVLGLGALLGIWAANSSPDLTVAVIEETGSKGPVTDVILGVTLVKDVVVIVLFTLVLALVRPLLGGGAGGGGIFWDLAREIGGALLIGGGLGWVFSIYLDKQGFQPPYTVFLFAYVLVVLADLLHLELLIMGVSAGFVIENLTDVGDEMIHGLESVAVVIFAFFFTIAGASLDLGAVGGFWTAAILLFSARLLLTYWGARLGTGWAESSEEIRVKTWKGLMSQGGVTLGLLLVIEDTIPTIGPEILALGMAIIIGNILAGPILLKTALMGVGPEEAKEEAVAVEAPTLPRLADVDGSGESK